MEKAAKSVPYSVTMENFSCQRIHYRTMEYSQPDKAATLYLEVASLHDVSIINCFIRICSSKYNYYMAENIPYSLIIRVKIFADFLILG